MIERSEILEIFFVVNLLQKVSGEFWLGRGDLIQWQACLLRHLDLTSLIFPQEQIKLALHTAPQADRICRGSRTEYRFERRALVENASWKRTFSADSIKSLFVTFNHRMFQ